MPFATAADGVRLSYEVIGAGPPLLLVSGQASDRHIWASARNDFAVRHRVIVFDHRGTGDSDKPEAPPYSTRGFANDAEAGSASGSRSITRGASARSCSAARRRATRTACAAHPRSTPSSPPETRCA
jgi:hypothetical protein